MHKKIDKLRSELSMEKDSLARLSRMLAREQQLSPDSKRASRLLSWVAVAKEKVQKVQELCVEYRECNDADSIKK